MFPIGDDNSARRSMPVVTVVLIALNVLFFFVELNGGDAFIRQWAFIPPAVRRGPGRRCAHRLLRHVHARRLAAPGRQHAVSVDFRRQRRRCIRPRQIPDLLSGVRRWPRHSRSTSSCPTPDIPNVGASGAIAGVLGAYLVHVSPRARPGAHVQSDRRPACADGARVLDRAAGVQRRRVDCARQRKPRKPAASPTWPTSAVSLPAWCWRWSCAEATGSRPVEAAAAHGGSGARHADPPEARQLERRAADIEAGHQAQHVDLQAFDPADGDAEQAAERQLNAGAARCRARRSARRRASPCRSRWAAGRCRPREWPPARRR